MAPANPHTSKIALHAEPKLWREKYGNDTDWLSWVEERLE